MDAKTSDDPAHRDLGGIAGGAWLSLLGRAANGVLALAYGIVLARLLDLRSVGIVMLGLTIIRIAEIVARMGLELGTLHYVAIVHGEGRSASIRGTVRNAVRLVLFFSVSLAAILAAAASLIARQFDLPELAGVVRILSLSLPPMSVTMVLLAALLGLKQVRYNTIGEKLVLPFFNLAACGLLLAAGFGMTGVGVAYMLAAALTLPFATRFFLYSSPPGNPAEAPVAAIDLLRFSAPMILVIIFNQLLVWTDTLMLGLLRTAGEVGIYGAAMRIALTAGMIVGSFNVIFAPTISDLYNRKELARLGFLYKIVGKWIFLATLPLSLVMFLLSEELMQLFGPAFVEGSTVLMILAFTQMVGASTGAVGFMLTMSGHQGLMLINTLVACAINLWLNALLIPYLGMSGAALATCISIVVFNIAALVEVRWAIGMHPYNAAYLRVLAAAVVPFAALYLAKSQIGEIPYLQGIVFYMLAYAALYVIALFLFGFTREDEPVIAVLKSKLLGRA